MNLTVCAAPRRAPRPRHQRHTALELRMPLAFAQHLQFLLQLGCLRAWVSEEVRRDALGDSAHGEYRVWDT